MQTPEFTDAAFRRSHHGSHISESAISRSRAARRS